MARNKTGALPGMERKKNATIERLADEYAELRDARMEASKKEVDAKTKLIDAMKKAGENYYEFEEDGETVTVELVVTTEKVKVRRGKHEEEAAD